jgi:hypothetical protein
MLDNSAPFGLLTSGQRYMIFSCVKRHDPDFGEQNVFLVSPIQETRTTAFLSICLAMLLIPNPAHTLGLATRVDDSDIPFLTSDDIDMAIPPPTNKNTTRSQSRKATSSNRGASSGTRGASTAKKASGKGKQAAEDPRGRHGQDLHNQFDAMQSQFDRGFHIQDQMARSAPQIPPSYPSSYRQPSSYAPAPPQQQAFPNYGPNHIMSDESAPKRNNVYVAPR